MLFDRWQGSSFTDQNKVSCTASQHVCEACVWAHSWTIVPGFHPEPPPGKRGVNLRLYSHLWDRRGYVTANKGDKPALLEWLRGPKDPPWFAAIADSGQKHVIPYARLNPGQWGQVRFEELDVELGAWELLDAMVDGLSGGVTKAEMETGDYSPRTYMTGETARWARLFEHHWARERGGGWFALCLWLAQRDEVELERRRDARRSTRGD